MIGPRSIAVSRTRNNRTDVPFTETRLTFAPVQNPINALQLLRWSWMTSVAISTGAVETRETRKRERLLPVVMENDKRNVRAPRSFFSAIF